MFEAHKNRKDMIKSLTGILQENSRNDTAGMTFIFGERSEKFVPYSRLYSRALGILHHLQERGLKAGDELLFQVEDIQDFIHLYWACLLGGIIPVPVTAGNNDEHRSKTFKIWDVLAKPWLIAPAPYLGRLGEYAGRAGLAGAWERISARSLSVEDIGEHNPPGAVHQSRESDIAFIQFSSGSTSDPKGVVLTHRNLLTNIRAMIRGSQLAAPDATLSWMPLTHDMGLIGFHLVPLAAGINQYIMPTQLFIRNPALWIDKACEHRATVLSSPNFGYKHFLSSCKLDRHSGWDLSHVRLIFNGAEPISAGISRRFMDALSGLGLKAKAMFPVYGLAEAVLAVSFPPVDEELLAIRLDRQSLNIGQLVRPVRPVRPALPAQPAMPVTDGDDDGEGSVTFVDLGYPVDDCLVTVCGEDGSPLADGVLGHIRISGPNVTAGYYRNPGATAKAISSDGWLDTGDLGYLRNGRLVVTGRAKDIIFVNGQNYYPHDIEKIAEKVDGIELGKIAACGVFNSATQKEDIVVFLRHIGTLEAFLPLALRLRKHLNRELGLEIGDIVPVRAIPKTTSGKVQRYKLGESYRNGDFSQALEKLGAMLQDRQLRRQIDAPATEQERLLAKLFADVLGTGQVGSGDNFFEIGGDSLKATVLLSHIQKHFAVSLQHQELFDRATVRELAAYLTTARSGAAVAIPRAESKEYYPVTSAQKRLYVLHQLDADSTAYNLPAALSIEGPLDPARVEQAFRQLITRHEILRTSFHLAGEETVQRVHPDVPFDVDRMDAAEADANRLIEEFVKPFDLGRAPLLRVGLIRLREGRHLLLFDTHHIISDGTSLGLLAREFSALYQGKALPETALQYRDYAVWQQEQLRSAGMKQHEQYWLGQFGGEIPVLSLPTDQARPPRQSFAGDRISFALEPAAAGRIKELAAAGNATLYMVLLAAYTIVLSRYSGQEDIVVGSPIAGRTHDELNTALGMFVNTLALRNRPAGSKRFVDFLEEVRRSSLDAYQHQEYPFEELVERVVTNRDISRNPVFDAMFLLQNITVPKIEIPGLAVTPVEYQNRTAQFDLSLEAREENGGLSFTLAFGTKLFHRSSMEQFARHFTNVVGELARDPEIKLCEIGMLSDAETRQLVSGCNNTETPYPRDRTIHRLFEEQAGRTPDQTAIVCNGRHVSYRQLDRRANQLAAAIRAKGVIPDDIAGVLAGRSIDLIAGLLGVLKAGAAYLPLDPDFPKERIAYMLADSQCRVLLTQRPLIEAAAPEFAGDVILLDELPEDAPDAPCIASPDTPAAPVVPVVPVAPENLAYVIYTSGSTGKPKGVMIEHRCAVNFISGMRDRVRFDFGRTVLALTTVSFDIFFLETLLPLTCGLKVVLAQAEEQKDPALLGRLISGNAVDLLQVTPSRLQVMLQDGNCVAGLKGVKDIIIGGEALPAALLGAVKNVTAASIFNAYGPTETTVWSALKDLTGSETVTIGGPIANTGIYILDRYDNLQPLGVPGELVIAGHGLARGYLGDSLMTGEKFCPNPFAAGQRIYRTGDLARRRPDGDLEFVGRLDNQVKVRGYRIELGEIESRLSGIDQVREAAVVARKDRDGTMFLCAYFSAEKEFSADDLRNSLSRLLPEYMIPSYFVQLGKLPQTPNGKIDRKALPEPDVAAGTGLPYHEPANETEKKLAALWREVLGRDRIGRDDNFFSLGGHSIKATVLASRIQKAFNVELPLREIFEKPTVKDLAQLIAGLSPRVFAGIKPAPASGRYPVSSAQKRLYVLHQFDPDGTGYNMPWAMMAEGPLQYERFDRALGAIVNRHESIRTSFHLADGEPVQEIHGSVEFAVERFAAGEEEIPGIIARFVRPFDLSRAPLLRAAVVEIPGGRHLVLFDMHHIISDGTSLGLLVGEFVRLYQGEDLPRLRLQYKDYAVWQQDLFASGAFKKEEQHWMSVFAGDVPVLSLPADYPRPALQSFEGDKISFDLTPDLSQQLERLAAEQGATLYMLLLAVFTVLISKYSGQEDVVVGSPVAGRADEDLEPVIGMFVNTLALRNHPAGGKRFSEFLAGVKTNALAAYQNQDYPFEALVDKAGIRRDASRNPLFDVMFVMQDMDAAEIRLDRLVLKPYEFRKNISQFDLTFEAVAAKAGIKCSLEYCTKLFCRETVERMAGHLSAIIEQVTKNPGIKLCRIDMLGEDERRQVITAFNDTAYEYHRNATVLDLFRELVRQHPDRVAITASGAVLTYGELHAGSNRIGRLLRSKGAGAGSIVGLMVDRSAEMMIAIWGVLKAGAAYLPIDPDAPAARIEYLLDDSKAGIVLTQRSLRDRIAGDCAVLCIDGEDAAAGDDSDLDVAVKPADLAYVIYTSGSTGRPKGVMVEHRNLAAYLHAFIKEYKIGPDDVVLQQAAYTFDTCVEELYPALLCGGRMAIASRDDVRDVSRLRALLAAQAVTVVSCSPLLLNELNRLPPVESIRLYISGGDALKREHVSNLIQRAAVCNSYGPTETTVCASYHRCSPDDPAAVPIGRPIANYRIYILDKYGQPLPVNVPGEICIAGEGVARGYLNRPELTDEKFVPDPFCPGERMYKTGDSGKWRPGGIIDFLGRLDEQVKIRGFRIEPGEIENRLAGHPAIKQAAVIARDDSQGNKFLCAYIVSDQEPTVMELREFLSRDLPDYMVPASFVAVEKLPLTSHGKLDRSALAALDGAMKIGSDYEGPRNETEERLAGIWREVLAVERVGINDNFFALGGDSIKAIQIAARMQKHHLRVEVPELFRHPTIKQLSHSVKCVAGSAEQGLVTGPVELTPIQKYFFERNFTGRHHWNQAVLLFNENGFDEKRLEAALRRIVEHHDALRMVFRQEGGAVVQFNRGMEEPLFTLESHDVPGADDAIKALATQIQSGMDLSRGPLVKAGLFKTARGAHLLIAVHHLVMDGISWRILLEDLAAAYEQAGSGQAIVLQEKSDSFKQWAVRLGQYAGGSRLRAEVEYWRGIEQTPVVPLPKDSVAGENRQRNGANVSVTIPEDLTAQLLTGAHKAYHTEINDLLLAALGMAVRQWTGQDKVLVSLEGHGREGIIEGIDISRTVGWFTTMYPVIVDAGPDGGLPATIKRTKEMLRHVPDKGIGYGILKYLSLPEQKKDLAFGLQPEISFNYLGQFDQAGETGLFALSPIAPGQSVAPESEREFVLDINGMVVRRQLELTVNYNGREYNAATIQKFADGFARAIGGIVEHCLAKDKEELTPSDYGDKDLSLEDLDEIMSVVEDI